MNRKVTYARLHTEAYVPGTGSIGTVLPPSGKTLDNLSMSATDSGLLVEFSFKAVKHEILIPSANVVLMTLAPEESKAKGK